LFVHRRNPSQRESPDVNAGGKKRPRIPHGKSRGHSKRKSTHRFSRVEKERALGGGEKKNVVEGARESECDFVRGNVVLQPEKPVIGTLKSSRRRKRKESCRERDRLGKREKHC